MIISPMKAIVKGSEEMAILFNLCRTLCSRLESFGLSTTIGKTAVLDTGVCKNLSLSWDLDSTAADLNCIQKLLPALSIEHGHEVESRTNQVEHEKRAKSHGHPFHLTIHLIHSLQGCHLICNSRSARHIVMVVFLHTAQRLRPKSRKLSSRFQIHDERSKQNSLLQLPLRHTPILAILTILLSTAQLHSRPLRNPINPLLQMRELAPLLVREPTKLPDLDPRPRTNIRHAVLALALASEIIARLARVLAAETDLEHPEDAECLVAEAVDGVFEFLGSGAGEVVDLALVGCCSFMSDSVLLQD